MRIARTVAATRAELRGAEQPIGLVPTMGALHAGHLSLLERARERCATVVMSLFVNPAQFAPHEDLAAYPRDEARDLRLAEQAGVDLLFAPAAEEMYPPGFDTTVSCGALSEPLEGAARGAHHFHAVATVVTKLLNIVDPQVAFFGAKDAQQALVVRRIVRDLDIPTTIEVCPTVRERDGLALSSRNAYLDAGERARAAALPRALELAAAAIAAGERDGAEALAAARAELAASGIEPEYLAIVDPETLAPATPVDGPVMVALAARLGRARLIDNVIATPGSR